MSEININDFLIDPNEPLPPCPNPPSRMLCEIDHMIESLDHVVDARSECEEYLCREMYRAFNRGRELYVLLEETETNRLQRARELVAFVRSCRGEVEVK